MSLKEKLKAAYEEGKQKGKEMGSFDYQMKKINDRKAKKKEEKAKLKELDNQGIPYCPKCHSTHVQFIVKKLSVGRAVVGGAIAGPTGAILGGLSSKKGKLKCLKCGHSWKI